MKQITLLFVGCLTLLAGTTKTFAWGKKGHELVAEVAFHYMDAKTKQKVLDYLNGTTIEEAATWMDEKRKDHSYDFMKPYHYVDFEEGEAVTEPDGDNIISRLNTTLRELDHKENLSKDEIKVRLFYLFHLVGDLHMPLHVGYKSDKGGNTYQLSFFGKGTNLHAAWDTDILEYKNISLSDCLKSNQFDVKATDAIQKIDVLTWAKESRSYLKQVYQVPDHQMTEAYVDANEPLIEKQILKAGLRLAAILNHYFKD